MQSAAKEKAGASVLRAETNARGGVVRERAGRCGCLPALSFRLVRCPRNGHPRTTLTAGVGGRAAAESARIHRHRKSKQIAEEARGTDFDSAPPDEAWKQIAGFFGLPVEFEAPQEERKPWATWLLFAAIICREPIGVSASSSRGPTLRINSGTSNAARWSHLRHIVIVCPFRWRGCGRCHVVNLAKRETQ